MFTDSFFPRINGVSVSVNSYAEELSKLGHTVCIVCPEYTEAQKKRVMSSNWKTDDDFPFQIIRVPSVSSVFSEEDRSVLFYKKHYIDKLMDDFSPDVIHINSEFLAGFFGALYARKNKIAYVYSFHTIWEDYFENYVQFLPKSGLRKIGQKVVLYHLKRADEIIVPTLRISDVAKKYGSKKQMEILPTGITEERIKFSLPKSKILYSQLFEKFPDLKNKQILIFIGRIAKEKNLLFLYDVLEEVRETVPDAALLFVGGGPYLETLKQEAINRNISDSVYFAGYVPNEEVVYYYHLGKVFVFPSLTETQGLVTVESMLSGTPVVAIEANGTVDVMQGDVGGFMVKENPGEFAEKVIELLKDEKLWRKKSEEALKKGEEMKISNLTPSLVKCYEKAINSKKN